MYFINNMSSSEGSEQSLDFDFCSQNKLNKHVENPTSPVSEEDNSQQSTTAKSPRQLSVFAQPSPSILKKNGLDKYKDFSKYRNAKSHSEESRIDIAGTNLSKLRNLSRFRFCQSAKQDSKMDQDKNEAHTYFTQQLTSKYHKAIHDHSLQNFQRYDAEKNDAVYYLRKPISNRPDFKKRKSQKYKNMLINNKIISKKTKKRIYIPKVLRTRSEFQKIKKELHQQESSTGDDKMKECFEINTEKMNKTTNLSSRDNIFKINRSFSDNIEINERRSKNSFVRDKNPNKSITIIGKSSKEYDSNINKNPIKSPTIHDKSAKKLDSLSNTIFQQNLQLEKHKQMNLKLIYIKNKLSELHEKMEKSVLKQLSIPVSKGVLEKKKEYMRNILIFDTNAENVDDLQNIAIDLTKHVTSGVKSLDTVIYTDQNNDIEIEKSPKDTVINLMDDINPHMKNDAEVQTSMIDENINQMQGTDFGSNNKENIGKCSMKDVSIMANVSQEFGRANGFENLESCVLKDVLNNNNQKIAEVQTSIIYENAYQVECNKEKHTTKDVSIMANLSADILKAKENLQLISNKENIEVSFKENNKNRKIIETIVLDILEMHPNVMDRQKQIFKECIDYIIEEINKRYAGTYKKSITKPKQQKKNEGKENVNNKKCKIYVNTKKRVIESNDVRKLQDVNIDKEIVVDKNPQQKLVSNNKIYESLECLTQTIRATLEELGVNQISPINHQSLHASFNSMETDWNGFNNKVRITSTPSEPNYSAKHLKNLQIMKKKIEEINNSKRIKLNIDEANSTPITTKTKCTKQITLTQTFKLQKKCNFQDPGYYIFEEIKRNEIDESQMSDDCFENEFTRIWRKISEWDIDKDPLDYGVEYVGPWVFNPDEMIQIENSQDPSTCTGLPCNQEALQN